MFFMFDFNSKKSLKQMNFLQREPLLLSFIQALLPRVTLLCLFENNKTRSKDIIRFEWELLFGVWKHGNLFQIYWHEKTETSSQPLSVLVSSVEPVWPTGNVTHAKGSINPGKGLKSSMTCLPTRLQHSAHATLFFSSFCTNSFDSTPF